MTKLFNSGKSIRWGALGLIALISVLGSVFYFQSALAAAELTISPITWDIIGLDSNDETSGPNHFPVGARVCNTGDEAASNVTSTFVWDSTNDDIYLRPGSLTEFSGSNAIASLGVGECVDLYYEVEVDRNDSARDTDREYHITATADGLATVSTPTPRKLFVEYLISQNRNATLDIKLDGVSVPAGGTMALVVGGTYEIELVASTATQGYNQIESFINFANTIFRINSVVTDYSAFPTPHTDPDWDNKLYADGCSWENDPNSPNFQSCLGVGKYGGDVSVIYNITIVGGAGSTETLSSLIYDFSGSSFHYNADYSSEARFAAIIDPESATIEKKFTPDTTGVGGVSTLSFILSNPNNAPLTGANFTDIFPITPGAMVVATPASFSTSGCGSPTFSPVAGAASISFADGTIPANGSCVVNVKVTVPTAGVYNNTSSNLFIGLADTGDDASAIITVDSSPAPPSCVSGAPVATWTFPTGFDINNPLPTTSSVATAAAIGAGLNPQSGSQDHTVTPAGTVSWSSNGGFDSTGALDTNFNDYFEFSVDTTGYSSIDLSFWARRPNGNAPTQLLVYYYYTTAPGTLHTTLGQTFPASSNSWESSGTLSFTSGLNPSGLTNFRIYGAYARNNNPGSDLYLDDVVFTGCGIPEPPQISKNFLTDPVAVDGTSDLQLVFTNPNSYTALNNVSVTDSFPVGLEVSATPSFSVAPNPGCGNPVFTPALAEGATTMNLSGLDIPASVTCTVTVSSIKATTPGAHLNITGFVSGTVPSTGDTITNDGPTGSGSDSLTAILPPQISKIFNPDSILENGVSTLTFLIVNPNPDNDLSGVQFTDVFPVGMVVASPATYDTNGCGTPTFTPVAGSGSVAFSNGTIDAGGNCTVQVDVTAPTIGTYYNTSGTVSAAIAGDGNTASDSMDVTAAHPGIAVLKQISTSATGPWTTFVSVPESTNVYYQFTVENTGDVPLTGVTVTDPTLNTTSPHVVCNIGALALYEVTTCAYGPVAAAAGWNYNTANSHGTYNTTDVDSDDSTASYATTGLSLIKSVYETAFTAAGDVLHYSYLVENTGSAPLQGPVTIDDDKSTDETCPPVNSVGDNDNWFDPGETITCSATYTVLLGDVSATEVTNIATATVDGTTSNLDTETVGLELSDYGDLPPSYNITLQTNDGPRHTRPTGSVLRLGPDLSLDSDGQEHATADGDTFDDGVFRDMTDRWTNGATVDIDLYLEGSGVADVGIWIDWNGDGSFGSGEFFGFTGLNVGSTQRVQVTVPDSSTYTVGNTLNVRVRAFVPTSVPGGSLDSGDFVGLANDGEVEDYQWEFRSPNAVSLADFSGKTTDLRLLAAFVGFLVLGAGFFFIKARKRKAALQRNKH